MKTGSQPTLKCWLGSFYFWGLHVSTYSFLGLGSSNFAPRYLGVNHFTMWKKVGTQPTLKCWVSNFSFFQVCSFRLLSSCLGARKFQIGTDVSWGEPWCLIMKNGTQPTLKCWVCSFCFFGFYTSFLLMSELGSSNLVPRLTFGWVMITAEDIWHSANFKMLSQQFLSKCVCPC